jgi:hypothetical protein
MASIAGTGWGDCPTATELANREAKMEQIFSLRVIAT